MALGKNDHTEVATPAHDHSIPLSSYRIKVMACNPHVIMSVGREGGYNNGQQKEPQPAGGCFQPHNTIRRQSNTVTRSSIRTSPQLYGNKRSGMQPEPAQNDTLNFWSTDWDTKRTQAWCFLQQLNSSLWHTATIRLIFLLVR
jgi:hypothetical protein